jgi:hypothetical protein
LARAAKDEKKNLGMSLSLGCATRDRLVPEGEGGKDEYGTRRIRPYMLSVCLCEPNSSVISSTLSGPCATVPSCPFLSGIFLLFAVNVSMVRFLVRCIGS